VTIRLGNLCNDCKNVHQVPVVTGARVQGMALVCEYHRPGWPIAKQCEVFDPITDDREDDPCD
jgi:hypothetical protein